MLDDGAVEENRHRVRQRERLRLVVGDQHRGRAGRAKDRGDLLPYAHAKTCVECGERFVQQDHPRLRGERPGQCDALLLTTRQLVGTRGGQAGQTHHVEPVRHSIDTGATWQAESHVLANGLVREQRPFLRE